MNVHLSRIAEAVQIDYLLEGPLDQIRVPAPKALHSEGMTDGLWEHTCFEMFVAAPGGQGYREFNFSPSGEWTAYAFSDYRQRMPFNVPRGLPQISVSQTREQLHLSVILAAAWLPNLLLEAPASQMLQVGLTAVIKAQDGSKTYWAQAHPAPKPDFHQRGAFLMTLPGSPVED